MAKYEELDPPVSSYDTDIGRYTDIADAIQGQESTVTVGFCIVDCGKLKFTIGDHCHLWQEKLSNLLYDKANTKLMWYNKYMEDNLAKFVEEPNSLHSLVEAFNLYAEVQNDCPEQEKGFPTLIEQFGILNKYEYELGEYTKSRFLSFAHDWHIYMMKLKDIEQMLKNAKEKLRKLFLAMAERFKKRVQELLFSFKHEGPYTGDIDSDTAVEQLAAYRQTMYDLQRDEQDLLNSLAIFEIEMPPNMDLKNFVKDLEVLESVWVIVYEWDGYWTEYAVEPFKTVSFLCILTGFG